MPFLRWTKASRTLAALLPLLPLNLAHMSIWHPSMYGVGTGFDYDAGDPVVPLDPGVQDMDEWWFRGPQARALKPQNGSVMELPAGGTAAVEIACNVAWTSYGSRTTNPSDLLSACPDNYGAYHTGDPTGPLDDDLLSGCALAVAYKSDIDEVGWDDLVVFSTNQTCVRQKVTTFDIPERMPPCPEGRCVCAWLWLANNGTANFYMTGFDCTFTHVNPSLSRPLLSPVDPVFCPAGNTTCKPAHGAKRPLYAYNSPSNVVWEGNDARPGYHASWSFTLDGAQDDIFQEEEKDSLQIFTTSSTKTPRPASKSMRSSQPHECSAQPNSSTSPNLPPPSRFSSPPNTPPPTKAHAPPQQSATSKTSLPSATGVACIVGDLEDLLSDFRTEKRDLTYSIEELRALSTAEETANGASRWGSGSELVLAMVLATIVML